jgi:hypothetical protein
MRRWIGPWARSIPDGQGTARSLSGRAGSYRFSSEVLPMMRIACAVAGIALFASTARADESKTEVKQDKNHVQIEKKSKRGKRTDKTKVESKARSRAGGGTVSKTETTVEHDRPGIDNDSKTKTMETKEKDVSGNVVREEKKVDK